MVLSQGENASTVVDSSLFVFLRKNHVKPHTTQRDPYKALLADHPLDLIRSKDMYNLETLGRFSKYKILLRDGMITMSILIINIVKKQYNTCSVESYIGHVQFKYFGSVFKIQSTTKR